MSSNCDVTHASVTMPKNATTVMAPTAKAKAKPTKVMRIAKARAKGKSKPLKQDTKRPTKGLLKKAKEDEESSEEVKTPKLTKQALAKHEKQLDAENAKPGKFAQRSTLNKNAKTEELKRKMQLYKESDGENIDFTADEWKCIQGQAKTALVKKGGEALKIWNKIEAKGVRGGKELMKRSYIKAWLRDPDFTQEGFMTFVDETISRDILTRTHAWMTTKRFFSEYGTSEANEMIAENRVLKRRNPENPRRFQYMVKKDQLDVQVENTRKRGLTGEKELDGKQYKKAKLEFSRRTLNDQMLGKKDRANALEMAFASDGVTEDDYDDDDDEGGEEEAPEPDEQANAKTRHARATLVMVWSTTVPTMALLDQTTTRATRT